MYPNNTKVENVHFSVDKSRNMLSNLKHFLKHSLVYGISNVATKAIGVILLPLYSTFLTLTEFGILGILEITIAIFTEIINLGMGPALVMLSSLSEFKDKKKSALFTILSMSFSLCIIFLLFSQFLVPKIAVYFGDPAKFSLYFKISSGIIFLRVLNNIFNDKLRADEKSIVFSSINLSKLIITLGLTIYFVAFLKLGVAGILYSYIIGESLTFLTFIPIMISKVTLKFDREIASTAVNFGLPLIFGSISMLILNISDRYILKYFSGYAVQGLYDLGYRLAGVLNMFFIMPLSMALMPIAYKIFRQKGDKRYFSKLMTYFVFVLTWGGLALSMFSKEILHIFALNPSYWPAYQVVPIIVFSYVFFGMRLISNLGMYLTKNTKYVAFITVAAAALNIILNLIFIPKFGMMAAAYSTLISFIILYILSDYFSSKYYRIPFENKKLTLLIVLGVILYVVSTLFTVELIPGILIKIIILIALPFILYFLNFYEEVEIAAIKGFYNKWKNPIIWKSYIKEKFKK